MANISQTIILASVCSTLGTIVLLFFIFAVWYLTYLRKSLGPDGEELLDDDCLRYKAWFCESRVKLSSKVSTPMGSKLTVVMPTVDIDFTVIDARVILRHVRMSRSGGNIMGSSQAVNAHSPYTGEAWYEANLCKEALLIDAVERELTKNVHGLRSRLFKLWYVNAFVESLNAKKSIEDIVHCLSQAQYRRRKVRILFSYERQDGIKEQYGVIVLSVSKHSIIGCQIDEYVSYDEEEDAEEFRLDRISNVQRWTREHSNEQEKQQTTDSQ